MSNALELVERLYHALEQDDTDPFLELCSESAVFEYPAQGLLSYGGRWERREGIGRFLDAHDEAEEIIRFEPGDMVAKDDTVLVIGFFEGRAKPSGRTWSTRFVHVLTLEGGRLGRWQAFFDSAAAVEAHR